MNIFESKGDLSSWHELIAEAKQHCGHHFSQGLDHYLVLTLQAFIDKTDIASNVLALSYLENIDHESHHSLQSIRYIGDQCLLLSGLFPERALKRNVSLEYYIDLGKNSYLKIATASPYLNVDNELFHALGIHFVGLMDVLHSLRLGHSE